MKKIISVILFISTFFCIHAQTLQPLTANNKASLRGLSVVNDTCVWTSGSNGTVGLSIDAGKTFQWITVPGYETKDFRDVEGFDINTALILAVDTPGIILKTKDGGKTWKEVFRDNTPGMFLDAMDFTMDGNGVVVGDPINNKLFYAVSKNFGDNWQTLSGDKNNYTADTGEAFFASSGTNVVITGTGYNPTVFFATGGNRSRLFLYGQPLVLNNILQGGATQGANSVAVSPTISKLAVVGGDFNRDTSSQKNIQLFTLKSNQLLNVPVQTPPHGYRSCVLFINDNKVLSCGLTGVDYSTDGGVNWNLISSESYNVCAKAKKGNAVFLAGKDGRIAILKN